MDKALALLNNLNKLAIAAAPTSPIGVLAISAAGFVGNIIQAIKNRQAKGEDTADLMAAVEAYGAALDELHAANAAYFEIPVKPE